MKAKNDSDIKKQVAEAALLSSVRKFSGANHILKELLKQNAVTTNKLLRAEISFNIAVNSYHLQDDADALLNFSEAFLLFKELEMYNRLAVVANNIGSLYKKKGNYKKSLAQFLEGIFLAFQNNDYKAMVASSIGIGIVLDDLHDFERALRAYDAAWSICELNGESPEFALLKCYVLVNKANSYARKDRIQEALELLTEAKILSSQFPQTNVPDVVEANLARILIDLGEFDKAYEILIKFEKERKLKDDEIYAAVLLNLGRIYKYKFKDEAKFLAAVKSAIKIYSRKNNVNGLIEANKILHKHYLTRNGKFAALYKSAYEKLEKKEAQFREIDHLSNMVEAELFAIESKLQQRKLKEVLSPGDFMQSTYEYQAKKITYRVPLHEIVFCEVKGNNLFIFKTASTEGDKLMVEELCRIRKPIKDFINEIKYASGYFVRIHSSFIVNLYWLSRFPQQNYSQLKIGDKVLRVSDNYRSDFRKKLGDFVSGSRS